LLPISVYHALHEAIDLRLKKSESKNDYVPFELADYVDNPIALARIHAGITQEALAKRMDVSQAYISKIEGQAVVTTKLLSKVKKALNNGG
jgi:ribosome-binding protein aMBF1 (putative translation factor)